MRQVIIYPGEDGYWVVECPSLPGCISQGKTREEAIENIKEAIEGYVEALRSFSRDRWAHASGVANQVASFVFAEGVLSRDARTIENRATPGTLAMGPSAETGEGSSIAATGFFKA